MKTLNQPVKLKQLSTKRHNKMTCIIGGKCSDGVVLISDSKITYDNHPPDYTAKLHGEFYPLLLVVQVPLICMIRLERI